MFVGQTVLMNKINSFTIDTLPKSLMLIGDFGCGKHTVCKYLSEKFNLLYKDCSENISDDMIDHYYSLAVPNLIVINLSGMYVKEQNTILKFLEEPPTFSFIVLLCEDEFGNLETINNRCFKLKFDSYSKEELLTFIPDTVDNKDTILTVAKTPGQIQEYLHCDINLINNYISGIINNLCRANPSYLLSISNKIAYKDEKGLFPFRPFIQVLLSATENKAKAEIENQFYLLLYKETAKMVQQAKTVGIDVKNVFEHYLMNIKFLSEEYGS